MLKKFTPRRYIAGITVGWGIVATLGGVVQSYAGLVAMRLVLGALEAGLFPGLTVSGIFPIGGIGSEVGREEEVRGGGKGEGEGRERRRAIGGV